MEIGVQELIDNLGKLALVREDLRVVIIAYSKSGLEVLSNTNDLVVKLGMLDVARGETVEAHARYREMFEETVRRAEAMAALATGSGRTN